MSLMFILAIALLITGHYFKMLRWRQLIEIYEKPRRSSLLQALSLGYLINFFVPFRAGDLVRGLWAGRKFKNGVGFSLATIIVDHYVDVPIVCAIFWIIFGFNSHSNTTFKSAVTYSILFAVLVVLSLILAKCNGLIKKTIRFSCGLFNSKIELKLMLFCFSGISTFKDLYYKIDKKRLVIYSALKWSAYVLSYFCMSNYLVNLGLDWSFGDVFATLFSFGNVNSALGVASFNIAGITVSGWFMMAIYVLIPVVFLFMLSFVPQTVLAKFVAHKKDDEINEPSAILNLLPQVNENDRLNFLELYFSNTKRDYLKKYLDLNRDIHIIEDFSAGSNATTMLCMDEQKTFYRKYAFGADGEKLHEQICWLQEHENDLLLPTILKEQHGEGYCCYDMEYNAAAVGLFNFIHSNSIEKSWAIIEVALTDLSENLHNKNARPANEATVDKYISGKIWGNIEKIEAAKEIRSLLEYDTLIINGKEYKNLQELKQWLAPEYLKPLFMADTYSDIHGDLTVENIICWENNTQPPYYFIDPNTGNLHESPALDFAKFLQSIHGGYEFLMRTKKVAIDDNKINFLFPCSRSYTEIFELYRSYLENRFNRQQVRSIFFHEVVHWLRLMPYKIEKNGKRSVLFYAGLIMVFNDVVQWYGEE